MSREFASLLEHFITEAHTNQTTVAHAMNINIRTFASVASGHSNFGQHNAEKVAHVLNIPETERDAFIAFARGKTLREVRQAYPRSQLPLLLPIRYKD